MRQICLALVCVWLLAVPGLTLAEGMSKEEMECRRDLQCWGDEKWFEATFACDGRVETLGQYAHKWTDGWLGAKFTHYRWKNKSKLQVTYIGDKIQFQNAFGAWIPHIYWCDYDTLHEVVLEVGAEPGRIPFDSE